MAAVAAATERKNAPFWFHSNVAHGAHITSLHFIPFQPHTWSDKQFSNLFSFLICGSESVIEIHAVTEQMTNGSDGTEKSKVSLQSHSFSNEKHIFALFCGRE